MWQMSDNFKVRDKYDVFFSLRISCCRVSQGSSLERRETEIDRPLPRGRFDARAFIQHCLVSLTFRVSLFSSTRQDVPFTRVLKDGNRNWPTDVSRECNHRHGTFESLRVVSAVNISIVNERRKVRPQDGSLEDRFGIICNCTWRKRRQDAARGKCREIRKAAI